MDAILLARLQFALSIGFHFLFPPTTLGLSLMILLLERRFLKSGALLYRELSSLLVRILGLVFVLGTATGIVMEFAFGNNWSQYARLVGDIFGAPLAAEGVFAFFMESIFLGILVFGRNRVSARAYWWSAFFVFLGAHLSGLWIIIANSWMQTPAGYAMHNGKAVLTDFIQAALNHSTLIRYLHTVAASWITAMLLLMAIAAWYLRRGRSLEHAKTLFLHAVAVLVLAACVQLPLGHFHSVQVAVTQPAKMAAFEALWTTRGYAPLSLFAWPDAKHATNRLYIGIPNALSLLVYGNSAAVVKGLDQVAMK
jgi:cytochrome bd ubiquinol oxidase subunit I